MDMMITLHPIIRVSMYEVLFYSEIGFIRVDTEICNVVNQDVCRMMKLLVSCNLMRKSVIKL